MDNKVPYTVRDIVDFILKNRKENGLGFAGWSDEQICKACIACMSQNTLLYSVNEEGNINGVMFGFVNGEDFRVINVLTTDKELGKKFVRMIPELFPNVHTLSFAKRGRERTWPLIESNLKHVKD